MKESEMIIARSLYQRLRDTEKKYNDLLDILRELRPDIFQKWNEGMPLKELLDLSRREQ